MILPDREIIRLCEAGMITPFDPELVNSASLDLRVGYKILMLIDRDRYFLEKFNGDTTQADSQGNHFLEIKLNEGESFEVPPNGCVLVDSLETFNVPEDVAGQVVLKSSRGREFWQHIMAGFIDPGFNSSVLTMELINKSLQSKLLTPGFRIAQVIWYRMESKPEQSYQLRGRYNGDKSTQVSKG